MKPLSEQLGEELVIAKKQRDVFRQTAAMLAAHVVAVVNREVDPDTLAQTVGYAITVVGAPLVDQTKAQLLAAMKAGDTHE